MFRLRFLLAVAALPALGMGCAAMDDLLNNPSGLAIQKFAASAKDVPAGTTVALTWSVEGAETIQIDHGIGEVKKKGSVEVRIDKSVAYTITARAGTSAAASTILVSVAGAPAASPTPTPTPTPSPTPTPTPSPSATPTPSPSAGACRLSSMAECGRAEGPKGVYGCCKEERDWEFGEIVERAIDKIQSERPQLFNGDTVRDHNAYVRGVAEILQRDFGVCSKQGGPEDEVAVKNSNGFSEQFDILLSSGKIRRNGYTVTCRPARF